jgi:hypothetical protein
MNALEAVQCGHDHITRLLPDWISPHCRDHLLLDRTGSE